MDIISAYNKAIAISIILIISYFFNQISRKYKIPSVILLIALGIAVKEFLTAFEIDLSSYLFETLELLAIVGLIMIVLEATLALKLKREKKKLLIQSFSIGTLSLILTTLVTAYLLHTFLISDFVKALIYAIPISILSSAIIIPSVFNLSDSKREFMIHESTFSDILGIMFFYLLIENVDLETSEVVRNVFWNILITLAASVLLSYGLILLLQHLDLKEKLFFLIAVLVLLYSVGKTFHLSSLMIIMIFGLVLKNYKIFFRGRLKKWIQRDSIHSIMDDFHVVTMESSFVVRTFLFVIFGMSLDYSGLSDLKTVLLGVGMLAIVYLIRILLYRAIIQKNIYPQVWIAPRGLVSVLLFFSIPTGLQDTAFNSTILMIVIVISALIMSVGLISRREDFDEMDSLEFDDWNELDAELERLNAEVTHARSSKKRSLS